MLYLIYYLNKLKKYMTVLFQKVNDYDLTSRSFLRHWKRTRLPALSILRFITSVRFLDVLKASHRHLKKQCRSQVSFQIPHLPIAGLGIVEALYSLYIQRIWSSASILIFASRILHDFQFEDLFAVDSSVIIARSPLSKDLLKWSM